MSIKAKNWIKSIFFGLLVLISSAFVHNTAFHKTGSAFKAGAIWIAFVIAAAALGLSFGLLISQFAKHKVSEEGRPSVVLRWSLWFCLWLVPSSLIGSGIVYQGSSLLRGFAYGSAWGAGITLFIVIARADIRSKRRARLSETSLDEELSDEFYDEFEDYEEAESVQSRPFGSVEEAFRPKYEYGSECVLCGKEHGLSPSVIRKWHRCTGCGNVYCDECGGRLPGKRGFLEAERTCPDCGSRTTLI